MGTGKRGFGSMDPAKHRALCREGGLAAHRYGTAHEWNSEEAKEAGRKGGIASRGGRGSLPRNNSGQFTQTDVGADVPDGGAA